MNSTTNKVDTIIIGSGISGLNLARKLAQAGQEVFIASKEAVTEGSSKYAQGGVAVVSPLNPEDKVESHIEDTLRAGKGLSKAEVVQAIVENAWPKVEELIKLGVKFDKGFNIEGSHSFNRVMHVADATGRAIMKPLLDRVSRNYKVSISQGTEALSLIKSGDRVVGARFVDIAANEFDVYANTVVLATGGMASIFKESTTPNILTGDGLMLAYEAGAELENLEFVQFHPTVMKIGQSNFLVTEALRGAGAVLRNINGELFAHKYHPDAELATRDIVSRAIVLEMQATQSDHVMLDLRSIASTVLKTKFPNITHKAIELGYDLSKDFLPVRPAAHYSIGGIKVNLTGQSSVPGLYAIGEAACNGFHGANRLASNSLLECIVVADFVAEDILSQDSCKIQSISYCSQLPATAPEDLMKIREIMTEYVSLERSSQGLSAAFNQLQSLRETRTRNLALLLVDSALRRRESRGCHNRVDFPQSSEEYNKTIIQSKVISNV